MPDAKPSPDVLPMKVVEAGKVSKHAVATRDYAAGKTRIVHLYQPPVTIPVPLLVVYDGSDYLHRGKLNIIVDNLLAMKRIHPFAMAMVNNGGAARSIEYSCGEATLGFIMECILPLAKEQMELESIEAGGYGIMGASLGGSMALFTALRLPQIFHKVLSQSGAFISPEYQSIVVDLVRYAPRPGIKIWMDAGRMEWLLEGNRQMHQLLKGRKYPVSYHEHSGGHNTTTWRNDVWRGLQSLYK
jgi:enterochelin esterase family protein